MTRVLVVGDETAISPGSVCLRKTGVFFLDQVFKGVSFSRDVCKIKIHWLTSRCWKGCGKTAPLQHRRVESHQSGMNGNFPVSPLTPTTPHFWTNWINFIMMNGKLHKCKPPSPSIGHFQSFFFVSWLTGSLSLYISGGTGRERWTEHQLHSTLNGTTREVEEEEEEGEEGEEEGSFYIFINQTLREWGRYPQDTVGLNLNTFKLTGRPHEIYNGFEVPGSQ